MFFELRQYRLFPGKREEWVKFMDDEIIPFQASMGMTIVGSFIVENDEDLYIWIRRFENEEERKRLYKAVYESEVWKDDQHPRVKKLLDGESIVVTRLKATPKSIMQ